MVRVGVGKTTVSPGRQRNNEDGREGFVAPKPKGPTPTKKVGPPGRLPRNYRGVVVVVVDVVSFCT